MIPESIKERISKEAEAASEKRFKDVVDELKKEIASAYYEEGYEAAAEQILMNPEQWGLAGSWVKCKDDLPDKNGLYIIEHKNGGRWQMFFNIEDKKWYWQSNQYSVCGDGFIERWLSESPTPSTDTAGLADKEHTIEFADWLSEMTTIIREEKITLYRYCDQNNEWGNYILKDIYLEFLEHLKRK
jgi:hypothetical protein